LCTEIISFGSVPEIIVFRCPGRAVPGGPIGFRLADTFCFGIKPKTYLSGQIKLLLKLILIPLLILRISGTFLGAPKPHYIFPECDREPDGCASAIKRLIDQVALFRGVEYYRLSSDAQCNMHSAI
jgi:hypothetical protein